MSQQQQQGSQPQSSMNMNFMNFLGQGGMGFDNMDSAGLNESIDQYLNQTDRLSQNKNFMQSMMRPSDPMSFFRYMSQNQAGSGAPSAPQNPSPQAPPSAGSTGAQRPAGMPGQQPMQGQAGAQQGGGRGGNPQMAQNILSQLGPSFVNPMSVNNPVQGNPQGFMGMAGSPGFNSFTPEALVALASQSKGGQRMSADFFQMMKGAGMKKEERPEAGSPMGQGTNPTPPSPAQASPSPPTTSESPTQGKLSGQKRRDSTISADTQPKKKAKKEEPSPTAVNTAPGPSTPTGNTEEVTIKQLLDINYQIIQKIRQNLFQGHIADNLQLIAKFRDNIIKVLTCMSTMPGIMSQMPPIPVKLNTICIPPAGGQSNGGQGNSSANATNPMSNPQQ